MLGAGGAAHHLFDPAPAAAPLTGKKSPSLTLGGRRRRASTTFFVASGRGNRNTCSRVSQGTVIWARDHAEHERRWISAPVDLALTEIAPSPA